MCRTKTFMTTFPQNRRVWTRAYWPSEAVALLKSGKVKEISLDHDLGDDARGTGYDVILWIEEAVATRGFIPPKIHVHSANSSARDKMLLGIAAIERLAADRRIGIVDAEDATPGRPKTNT